MHWQLTGEQVLGVGDASGMFPIDTATGGYDAAMLAPVRRAGRRGRGRADRWPTCCRRSRVAGAAGRHAHRGRRARCSTRPGALRAGAPLCPPEGDAGTGMVATNSVAPRTGNVSAGTSIFAMVVLERELGRVHRELDLVTTPAGDPVAMVHCNNGASELDAWVGLFAEFAGALGADVDTVDGLRDPVPRRAGRREPTAAGCWPTTTCPVSRSPTSTRAGRCSCAPRTAGSTLATFMRTQLYASLATLRIGMDVLQKDEGVRLDRMFAHGGLFKTEGVAQRFLAAAIDTPVSVGDVAAEGGAWGIAVLAAFAARRRRTRAWPTTWTAGCSPTRTCRPSSPTRPTSPASTRSCGGTSPASPVERAAVDHVRIGPSRPTRPRSRMTATPTEHGTHRAQREHVAALHAELTRYELVTWTVGQRVRAGARRGPVRHQGQRRRLRRADLGGHHRLRPRRQRRSTASGRRRRDTAAHAYVYRNMPEVGGQVHTHSTVRRGVGGARARRSRAC